MMSIKKDETTLDLLTMAPDGVDITVGGILVRRTCGLIVAITDGRLYIRLDSVKRENKVRKTNMKSRLCMHSCPPHMRAVSCDHRRSSLHTAWFCKKREQWRKRLWKVIFAYILVRRRCGADSCDHRRSSSQTAWFCKKERRKMMKTVMKSRLCINIYMDFCLPDGRIPVPATACYNCDVEPEPNPTH
jgi:hypothetical protein